MDGASAAVVIARADGAVGDFVIDYEHQTLHSEANGQPAPAAGWFKKIEWREGVGLLAVDVRWTPKARAAIEAGEYRYISPVLEYDTKTGVVLAVPMAALTNYPALDGLTDLAARAAAKLNLYEEETVDREKLIALLGLAANADDATIEQAITALNGKAAEVAGKDAEIVALKKNTGNPDPAKFVSVESFEALKTDLAALKSQQVGSEVESLVSKGLADGKLLPVQEPWAKELGATNIAALKSYLEKTPAIAALSGSQTQGKKPADGAGSEGLNETELAVCRNLGLSAEEYSKAKA